MNWLTYQVNHNTYFKRAIPVMGYCFDFSDVLRRFWVKSFDHIAEYYACDRTSLRASLGQPIQSIVELPN